jgi:hypothetical protein
MRQSGTTVHLLSQSKRIFQATVVGGQGDVNKISIVSQAASGLKDFGNTESGVDSD